MDFSKFHFYSNTDKEFEKYMLGEWDNKHITLRIWNETKEFDLHIKNLLLPNDHPDKYYTIIKMKFSELEKFGEEFIKFDLSKAKQLFDQKINFGKLGKRNCHLVSIGEKEDSMNRIFKISPNNRRIKFRNDLLKQDFSDLVFYPDEILSIQNGAFLVYERKRGVERINGFVYRFPFHKDTEFAYVSKKSMNKFQKEVFLFFFQILRKMEFENKEWVIGKLEEIIKKRFPYAKI